MYLTQRETGEDYNRLVLKKYFIYLFVFLFYE